MALAIGEDMLVETSVFGPSVVSDVMISGPDERELPKPPPVSPPVHPSVALPDEPLDPKTPSTNKSSDLAKWLSDNRLPPSLEAVLRDVGAEVVLDLATAHTDPDIQKFISESRPFVDMKLMKQKAFWKAVESLSISVEAFDPNPGTYI